MELKIAASDMLTILIDSGIDETDSKAIIFDIIQIQGAESQERQKLIEVRRERKKSQLEARKKATTFKTEQYDEDDDYDDEYGDEKSADVELEAAPKVNKRRVNFSSFGGNAEPIK